MDDILGKVIAIILSVLLLYIFPISNMFERQDDTTRILVLTETSKFVDSVRNLGCITPVMYQEFAGRLSATNNIYKIELEHYHKRFDPVYDDPAIVSTFKNSYKVNYKVYYTEDIRKVLFPDNASSADRTYKLTKGDYFAVKVYNINKTTSVKIQEMLYNADLSAGNIMIRYGGMIKSEAD